MFSLIEDKYFKQFLLKLVQLFDSLLLCSEVDIDVSVASLGACVCARARCSEDVLHRGELLKVCVLVSEDVAGLCRSAIRIRARIVMLQKAHADVARCVNGLISSIQITKSKIFLCFK